MRKGIWTLSLLVISICTWAQQGVVDKVIAVVGGELVLLSEVEEQRSLMESQTTRSLPENIRCEILDQILTTKLLLNQAKLDSVMVTDEEVEDQLDARIQRILDYMNGDVSQFEDYYGQTVSEAKDQFREDLLHQLLVERMRAEILARVKVTPSEVRSFFESIPNDSLPFFNAEVEIGEIVYKPKVSQQEKERAIRDLNEIRELILEDGKDFGEMAAKYSDDGSARMGGDLGWARRGKFVPEFEAAAFKLEKNEISPVIETQFGYHLIQMLERRGNSIHLRHILIRPKIKDDDLEKAFQHLDSIRHLIIHDSLSFSRAVKMYSEEDVQSYNNDGRMVNPLTGNTFFEIGDLDPDIYFAIDTMEVGKITAPFEFRSPSGDPMFRIVQLQSRTPPHKANIETDYSKIRTAAIESKKNEYINEWLDERVRSTFIQVDPMYDKCEILAKWRRENARP